MARIVFQLGCAFALAISCCAAVAQDAPVLAPNAAAIRGTVTDPAAKPIAGASVAIESEGQRNILQEKTDAQGNFILSPLAPGRYRVTAARSGWRSESAGVVLSPGETQRIDLTLRAASLREAESATPAAAGNAMQFADRPNFTVAGVTDWTAVGGHGSDATLRASEALARETIRLKPENPKPEKSGSKSHRLSGELAEKNGDSLTAVREFEQAVRLDPSEENYFSWGSELLLHRAIWQARQVFSEGVEAYPRSARLLTALGAALFAGDVYEEAARRLCQAADLEPATPAAYLFLGRIEIASPTPLDCAKSRLERFARERPDDALASFYYAMSLLKRIGPSPDPEAARPAEEQLQRAVAIDPKCGDAYLQLGILASARRNYEKAIGYYAKAIEADPQLEEAHYRLAVAYDRTGKPSDAKREFKVHDDLKTRQAGEIERQRREIKQFLIVLNNAPATAR